MSMVVGVCSTNFCSLIADGRRVTVDGSGNMKIAEEKFQKIFKVNDRVMLGATGWFQSGENLLSPIKDYCDPSAITMRMAKKAVLEYIERNQARITTTRNYILGGKDNKGRYCLYEIHVDGDTHSVEVEERIPSPPYNFGVSCALPQKLAERKQEFLDLIGSCITSCKTHEEMKEKLAAVIREVSDLDDTVGKEIACLTVQ